MYGQNILFQVHLTDFFSVGVYSDGIPNIGMFLIFSVTYQTSFCLVTEEDTKSNNEEDEEDEEDELEGGDATDDPDDATERMKALREEDRQRRERRRQEQQDQEQGGKRKSSLHLISFAQVVF